MIQRIQTIYLLLASVVSGGFIFVFNLWDTLTGKIFAADLFFQEGIQLRMIPVLFLASAVTSFVAIFLYNKRQLQFVIGRIVILINLFLLGLLIYLSLTLPGEKLVSEKGIGMFLPILAILLIVLANKAIKKDEDLVKSVDRLR
jgi:drug/metabolite transporter (DMT)-like permease